MIRMAYEFRVLFQQSAGKSTDRISTTAAPSVGRPEGPSLSPGVLTTGPVSAVCRVSQQSSVGIRTVSTR